MDIKIYCVSTIKSPKETEGIIGYVLEVATSKGPATLSDFHRVIATKNQAQIMCLNMALARINKKPATLSIYADFDHLRAAFEQGWIVDWVKNGWKNAKGDPVGNATMWQETLILLSGSDYEMHSQENEYKGWLEREAERRKNNV